MNLSLLFEHILRVSLQASALVIMVLLAQTVFRCQLNARWRYALWGLVFIRLLLPVSVQSPLSVFNMAQREVPGTWVPSFARDTWVLSDALRASTEAAVWPTEAAPEFEGAPPTVIEVDVRATSESEVAHPRRGTAGWKVALPVVWFAVTVGLVLIGAWRNVRFAVRLRNARVIEDAAGLDLLDDCRRMMSVTKPIAIVPTGLVSSPALYGFLHHRLLVPPGMLRELSTSELRHVFLHELAHVRRRDMAVHWIMSVLRVLHWFNPVVWLAFRRINADRELACDELVLSVTGPESGEAYGRTIIKLMERALGRHPAPGAVGISEDQHDLERRMTMIANFNPNRKGAAIALALLTLLGVATLTDGQTAASEPRAKAVLSSRSASEPRSAEAAVAFLTQLGADITRDEANPGQPVTGVSISNFDPSRGQVQTFLFDNTTAFKHYRFTVRQVQYSDEEEAPPEVLRVRRCMQLREVELLDAENRDLTRPADSLIASSSHSPAGEEVANAIDDLPTKYLNFDTADGTPAGFIVTPSSGAGRAVKGLSITSANDGPSRDPKLVTLEGSNDAAVTAWDAGTWTLIVELEIPAWTDLWPESDPQMAGNEYLDAFEQLPALRELRVPGPLVSDAGMERLSRLPNLETLIVYGRTWVTDRGMAHLPAFPKLEHLDLYDTTEVTDRGMQYLAERPHMRRVGLVSSRLSGSSGITDKACSYLKNMSRLDSLLFMGSRVTDDGLKHFRGLTNLTFINLSANPLITGEGLEHFLGMKKLHTLWIFNTGLSDTGLEHLGHLTSLQLLSLSGTYITDEGLAHVGKLTRLETLDLGTEMRPTLSLGGTQIGDAGLRHLQSLKALKTLYLDRTQVADAGMEYLKALDQLQILHLTYTKVGNAGLEHLKSLKNLQGLSLYSTQVTDAGLTLLKELPQLQWVDLSKTGVTDKGLKHLGAMKSLEAVLVRDTPVTQVGINELKRQLPGVQVAFE